MRNIFILVIALFLTACGSGIPSVKPYKLDIQQGNVVTSKMLLQLRPGMTKSQVRYIMGTPLIQDSFHGNRWDYFYENRVDGKIIEHRNVFLTFNKNLLDKVEGDVVPKGDPNALEADNTKTVKGPRVVVPTAKPKKEGFFDKLKFWKKDEAEAVEKANAEAEAAAEMVPEAAPAAVEPVDTSTEGFELKQTELQKEQAAKEKGMLEKLKFWKDDEPEPRDVVVPVESREAPTASDVSSKVETEVEEAAPESQKKGFFSRLKFWGDDEEENPESLSGVKIETLPEAK